MKKLPLGIQTFKRIIEENYLYVDKTKDIYNLLTSDGIFFFLSRPRRFGKSLLVTTLKEIFSGNKELFRNLWIYDKIEWKKYPVIHIDFLGMNYSKGSELFESTFFDKIKSIGIDYGIKLKSNDYKSAFKELITELSKIEKVVILIDEYDKPIIEHIEKIPLALENRNILKGFFEILKESEQNIKFAFLTGVSKFSKVSVFSGLNNITDITLDEKFSTLLGYTEDELKSYFTEHLKKMAEKSEVSDNYLVQTIKNWYNGYSWNGENFVYNPYSILSLFNHKDFGNYWFVSGTPTFLIKLIKNFETKIETLEKVTVQKSIFESYDIDNMSIEPLLFQTGYLTVKEIIKYDITNKDYILSYPNLEVKESFLRHILNSFTEAKKDCEVIIDRLYKTLKNNDLAEFFKILTSMFSDILFEIFIKDKEAYYHTIIYLVLKLIGVRIRTEILTNLGRIDALIETENQIFILEFKLGTAQKALKQIESMKYHEAYISSGKSITLIGIGFDTRKRNIKNYLVKKLDF